MSRHPRFLLAVCVAVTLAGSVTERNRAGTMEGERKRLQGRWALVSLTVTTENGRKSPSTPAAC